MAERHAKWAAADFAVEQSLGRLSLFGVPVGKIGGPAYDFPIAVALLMASGQALSLNEPALFLGGLSLGGQLRHTSGILPMVSIARSHQLRTLFVPAADRPARTGVN